MVELARQAARACQVGTQPFTYPLKPTPLARQPLVHGRREGLMLRLWQRRIINKPAYRRPSACAITCPTNGFQPLLAKAAQAVAPRWGWW